MDIKVHYQINNFNNKTNFKYNNKIINNKIKFFLVFNNSLIINNKLYLVLKLNHNKYNNNHKINIFNNNHKYNNNNINKIYKLIIISINNNLLVLIHIYQILGFYFIIN